MSRVYGIRVLSCLGSGSTTGVVDGKLNDLLVVCCAFGNTLQAIGRLSSFKTTVMLHVELILNSI